MYLIHEVIPIVNFGRGNLFRSIPSIKTYIGTRKYQFSISMNIVRTKGKIAPYPYIIII